MRASALLFLFGCQPEPEAVPDLDPGRVTYHRLTRREYDNAVRDLLGTAQRPGLSFPADDFGYGFSNIADVLSTSPVHVELYELAAASLVQELLPVGNRPTTTTSYEAEAAPGGDGADYYGWAWQLHDVGSWTLPFEVPEDGSWRLDTRAFGTLADGVAPQVELRVDGTLLATLDIDAPEVTPGTYPLTTDLGAGPHTLSITYLNEYRDGGSDRNVMFDRVDLVGPIDAAQPESPGRALVLTCDPAAIGDVPCAEEVLDRFAARAWRRPITPEERTALLAVYAADRNLGGDWQEGLGFALRAVLMSPHFLFKAELDPDPADPNPRALDAYELASRLSFFLWSSIPDERLTARAADGSLLRDDVLEAEARRMLADPKAEALLDGLATEWLYTEAVTESAPDPTLYPEFDEALRASMIAETHLFVADILLGDRSMLDLLSSEETFLDDRLAAHYGIEKPPSDGFTRVDLHGTGRKGLLSQGAFLTALSYPNRTSPVRRGKWVISYLLCEAPAPPAFTPVFPEPMEGEDGPQSLRETMEEHRNNPACASCHVVMDDIGFALEPFDAVGRFRTIDDFGAPIDATGTMPDGSSFDGPAELADVLANDPKVPFCAAQNTFTYALQRPPRVEDIPALDAIVATFQAGGYRFADLAVAVVLSDAFRFRTGEVDAATEAPTTAATFTDDGAPADPACETSSAATEGS